MAIWLNAKDMHSKTVSSRTEAIHHMFHKQASRQAPLTSYFTRQPQTRRTACKAAILSRFQRVTKCHSDRVLYIDVHVADHGCLSILAGTSFADC